MPARTHEDVLIETIAAEEALDQASSVLGLRPIPVTLAAVRFAARTTAHTDVTEEEFVEGCRSAFRASRQRMQEQPDLAQTCPQGFLRTLLRFGAARSAPAPRARLRLVRGDG